MGSSTTGVSERHGVFELPLAIFGGVDAEIFGRVIALAVANARARHAGDAHADARASGRRARCCVL